MVTLSGPFYAGRLTWTLPLHPACTRATEKLSSSVDGPPLLLVNANVIKQSGRSRSLPRSLENLRLSSSGSDVDVGAAAVGDNRRGWGVVLEEEQRKAQVGGGNEASNYWDITGTGASMAGGGG